MTVADVYKLLDEKAPFASAEEWDNAGLLAGDGDTPVTAVLVCLDITPAAVELARTLGAELVVSHHPVIFHGLTRLPASHPVYHLAAAGLAAICAHTNLDRAPGGVNDTLAGLLGLRDIQTAPDGLCRTGLSDTADFHAFAETIQNKLGAHVKRHGAGRPVKKIAVCGGAGGDFLADLAATDKSIDTVVVGELKLHEWLLLNDLGVNTVEAGHYETETPVLDRLCGWLAETGLKVHVFREKPYEQLTSDK